MAMYKTVPLFKLLEAERFIILSVYCRGRIIRRHAVDMLNGGKKINPLKVYQKGNEKTNSLTKSDGKLNCGELSFLSGSTRKHITEMSAKVFPELTFKGKD